MSEVKFLLIEHGYTHQPAIVTVFDSEGLRETATLVKIFGTAHADSPSEADNMEKHLEILKTEGSINFEGDPPIEWLTALIEL